MHNPPSESPPMQSAALIVHAFSTIAMTGVIWFVQIVHYPLFARVAAEGFAAYEYEHAKLTGFVVMPLMLAELATALALATVLRPAGVPAWIMWAGFALVGVIWLSTFLVQVPQHEILSRGFDAKAHRFLVDSNWIRTVAWTLRSALAIWLLTRVAGAES